MLLCSTGLTSNHYLPFIQPFFVCLFVSVVLIPCYIFLCKYIERGLKPESNHLSLCVNEYLSTYLLRYWALSYARRKAVALLAQVSFSSYTRHGCHFCHLHMIAKHMRCVKRRENEGVCQRIRCHVPGAKKSQYASVQTRNNLVYTEAQRFCLVCLTGRTHTHLHSHTHH